MRGGSLPQENLLPPTTPGQQQLGTHTPPFLRPQVGLAMPLLDPGPHHHPLNPTLLPSSLLLNPCFRTNTNNTAREEEFPASKAKLVCTHSISPHKPPSLALSDQMSRVSTSWISQIERTQGSVFRELAESKPDWWMLNKGQGSISS